MPLVRYQQGVCVAHIHYHQPLATHTCSYLTNTFHSPHHATHVISSAISNTYTLFIPHQHIPFTTSQQHIHYHQPLATHTPCSYLTNTFHSPHHSNTFTMSAISNIHPVHTSNTLHSPHHSNTFTIISISNRVHVFIPHQHIPFTTSQKHIHYHQPLATHTPCSYLTNTFHSPHHSNTFTMISW